MSRLPRCKYCRARVLWARDWDGRMIPVELCELDADLVVLPHEGGWKTSRPNDVAVQAARGFATGRQHYCPPKEAKS